MSCCKSKSSTTVRAKDQHHQTHATTTSAPKPALSATTSRPPTPSPSVLKKATIAPHTAEPSNDAPRRTTNPELAQFYDANSFRDPALAAALEEDRRNNESLSGTTKFYDARSFETPYVTDLGHEDSIGVGGSVSTHHIAAPPLTLAPLERQISDTGVGPCLCPISMTGPIALNKGKKYRTFALADFLKFRHLADGMEKWTLRYSAPDGTVFSWDQPPPPGTSSYNLVKVFGIYPDIAPNVMYDVLHDANYRKEWDDAMIKGYNICQLNVHNDIGYYSVKTPSPASNRDFCNLRAWIATVSGEYIIMNTSVKHADQPEVKGYVRGFSFISGYLIRPHGEGGCSMTYLTQSDPGGWLPSSLMNQVTAKFAPNLMVKLGGAARKYLAWKSKNNPDHRPWLASAPVEWPEAVTSHTQTWVSKQKK